LTEDIDALIQKKEAKLESLCSHMEELKAEFIQDTFEFVSKWYEKTAKEYVTKYPEITLAMSEEKIARMKTKIVELVADTERIVKNELQNPNLWWHQKPQLHASIEEYTQVAEKYPEILDKAVRRVLGRLGVVLEDFRFHVNSTGNTGSYEEFWFERQPDSERIIPFYPHLITWSEEMQYAIKRYNDQFVQAITLFNEIQKLKEEKRKREALSRWESI
jgi:predicted DNA binding CopG/RHH family protein